MAGSTYNPLEGPRPDLVFDVAKQYDEKISIIIIHNDRPEYLNIAVQTTTVCSMNNNFELIIVDNGSGQRSQDYLDQLEADGVKVIRNNENLFWAKAANQGVKQAHKDSKYLVFMHHDVCIVNPAWLDMLINVADSTKSGLVGTRLRNYEMNQQKYPFIHESCMLVSRECWQDCGPFEEDLPQEGSPFIFTLKAGRKGYNPQCIDQKGVACVYHYGIFALDFNEHSRLAEKAQMLLPKFIAEVQKI